MLNKINSITYQKAWSNKNTWEFKSMGYWYSCNYFIEDKDCVELQKALKKIALSTPTKLNKGTVVYASKASDIPRFKLKEFIKDNELKKTSRHAYADVIIINKGIFNELISHKLKYSDHTFINQDLVKKNFKKWFGGNTFINSDEAPVLVTDLSKTMLKELQKDSAASLVFTNSTHKKKGISIHAYRENKMVDLLELIIHNVKEINSDRIKFVFDEDLFVELNKEGIELDDEYYQTLRDMLFSKDDANVKLGFEMMSNLVVNDHMLLSVSFLLNELIHTTKFRPSYYTNTNSNLKSLLKVLSTRGIRWERDWKTFGTGLRANFKTGTEGEIVKKFLLDNINREFKLSNSAAESLVDIVFTTEAQ